MTLCHRSELEVSACSLKLLTTSTFFLGTRVQVYGEVSHHITRSRKLNWYETISEDKKRRHFGLLLLFFFFSLLSQKAGSFCVLCMVPLR